MMMSGIRQHRALERLQLTDVKSRQSARSPSPDMRRIISAKVPDFDFEPPQSPARASSSSSDDDEEDDEQGLREESDGFVGSSQIYVTLSSDSEKKTFGSHIRCYKELERYRHLFHKVSENSYAHQLKIRENDELIIFNDFLSAEMTHSEIVKGFDLFFLNSGGHVVLVTRHLEQEEDGGTEQAKREWVYKEVRAEIGVDLEEVILKVEVTREFLGWRFVSLTDFTFKGKQLVYITYGLWRNFFLGTRKDGELVMKYLKSFDDEFCLFNKFTFTAIDNILHPGSVVTMVYFSPLTMPGKFLVVTNSNKCALVTAARSNSVLPYLGSTKRSIKDADPNFRHLFYLEQNGKRFSFRSFYRNSLLLSCKDDKLVGQECSINDIEYPSETLFNLILEKSGSEAMAFIL